MERREALARLRRNEQTLRRAGIGRLYLFGSTARDDAGPESDVDLFFETDEPHFSLIELVRAQEVVRDVLGAQADLMTRDSLHPALRDRIERSAERVYG
jgi:predicted nucleotidyltransferase